MSENQLEAFVSKWLFVDLANHALEVNDHQHFMRMRLATTKVKASRFELEDAICERFEKGWVV